MHLPRLLRSTVAAAGLLLAACPDVRADSLNFISNPAPGRIVAKFDFNNPDDIPDALYIDSQLARISSDPADTLNGTPALIGKLETTTDADWNVFFELRPGLLLPNKVYRVTFDYKVLEAAPQDGQICCSYRPDKRIYATTFMGNEVGVKKRISTDVTPGDEPNCGLRIGMVKGGVVAVDNILIEELPAIDVSTITYKKKKGTWKDFAGIAAHLDYTYFYKTDAEVTRMLDMLQEMGVGMIRCGFHWKFAFPKSLDQPDPIAMARLNLIADEAAKRGIQILGLAGIPPAYAFPSKDAYASPEDYRRYLTFIAETFKGRIRHWEISNEPDIPHGWRSPFAEYTDELKLAYPILKSVDPQNFVINAGFSTVIFRGRINNDQELLHKIVDPAMAPYYDALCLHIYPWNTTEPLYSINSVVALMKQKKVSKPIWITETGYSVFAARTEEQQADFLEQMMVHLAAHPKVEKLFTYNARQKTHNKSPYESGMGIITYDFKPRPAYERLKKLYATPFPNKNPSFADPSVGLDDQGLNGL